MDASAGAGGEGDDRKEWGRDDGVGGEEAFVGWGVGGGVGVGGMAHLEGEAVVFVDEEVRAGEGDVVVEVCDVLVDVVAVWPHGMVSFEGGEARWRGSVPENMSSLNSWHPFSNFSTGSQVRDVTRSIHSKCGVAYCLS